MVRSDESLLREMALRYLVSHPRTAERIIATYGERACSGLAEVALSVTSPPQSSRGSGRQSLPRPPLLAS